MPDLVLTERNDGGEVAIVTLNRPEARNPVSIAMLEALDKTIEALGNDETVRVVILTGAGPVFCAGLDLAEVKSETTTIQRLILRLSQVMRRIRRMPVATIAQVQGAAIGAGFGLMASADFAITHADAKIGYPSPETGFSPAALAPWLISKIGPARARTMLLKGGCVDGRTACDTGIVSQIAPKEAVAATAKELARKLAVTDRNAMGALKSLINDMDISMDDGLLDRAANISADVISGDETQRRLRKLFPEN